MRLFFGLFLLVLNVVAKHEEYSGYSLLEVKIGDASQIEIFNELANDFIADVWTQPMPKRPGLVMIAEDVLEIFITELDNSGIEYTIEAKDVSELLQQEDKLLSEASSKTTVASRNGSLPFDRIYTYEEIDAYLEKLADEYPNVVTLVLGGYSFEGRPIKYLKISSSNFEDNTKPIVYMQSLLHAREWITLPATLYAIEKLVIDVQEQDLIRDIDWIIVPIVNPDGYVFTHDSNRLWRKNRATGQMINDLCVGVDLNRNFDTSWSSHSSNIPCSEVFHGQGPFSEPETSTVRDILAQYGDRTELFLDIHSFGSMILFGFGTGILPPNALILNLVAVRMAIAIDNVKMPWNNNYIVGNTAHVLYHASGTAQDYAQENNVPLSYTFELPGFRFGLGTGAGFLVDPDFIEQAGFETWEGIKVGARFVRDGFINVRHH